MKTSLTDDSVILVDFGDFNGGKDILWISDMHFDSKYTDRKWLKRQLDDNKDAYIIIGGDSGDLMQNVNDRRQSKSDLKPQHKSTDYLNRIIDDFVKWWKPYAHRIIGWNTGNHETAQLKFHGVDLISWIVTQLNVEAGTNIIRNDFQGWYIFKRAKSNNGYQGNTSHVRLFFQHKPIAGGTRSKGSLSIDIAKGRYPDADIIIAEDIHTTWIHPFNVERINKKNMRVDSLRWYIQMPTLKEEHHGRKIGYVHHRNFDHVCPGIVKFSTSISHGGKLMLKPDYILKYE